MAKILYDNKKKKKTDRETCRSKTRLIWGGLVITLPLVGLSLKVGLQGK